MFSEEEHEEKEHRSGNNSSCVLRGALLNGRAPLEGMGHGDPCPGIGAKITLISYQKSFWFTFPHLTPDLQPAPVQPRPVTSMQQSR